MSTRTDSPSSIQSSTQTGSAATCFRTLIAAALLATLGACNSPVESTLVNSDLAVSIAVSRAAFKAVDGTMVAVTMTNRGRSTIMIKDRQCQTPFEVLREAATIVATHNNPCPAVVQYRALKAGDSITDEYPWNGSDWNWAYQLNPGSYQLRGKVFVGDDTVMSNPISVVLLPQ